MKKSLLNHQYISTIAGFILVLGVFATITASAVEIASEKIFQQNCMVCHDDDGSSAMPGVPELTKKDAWLLEPEQALLSKLKQGIQTPGAPISMPPKGGNPDLSDEELLAVIAWLRKQLLK